MMRMTTIFCILVVGLSACVAQSEPSTTVAVAQSTAISPDTNPTQSPAPTEAIIAEPTVPQDAPVLIYERSGGIRGDSERWWLTSNGKLIETKGSKRLVSAEKVTTLLDEITTLGFFDMPSAYKPPKGADLQEHTLQISYQGKIHQITVVDATPTASPELYEILGLVRTLISTSQLIDAVEQ